MSTNDVPGYEPRNADELAMGCWGEHEDGSLIFVESTEGGRVIYSIFDMAQTPVLEFRDAMPEKTFKKNYSWSADDGKKKLKWTWHDKTPFPWEKVIKSGAKDGVRHASADDQMSAAQKVAESLKLRAGRIVDETTHGDRLERTVRKAKKIMGRLQDVLKEIGGDMRE